MAVRSGRDNRRTTHRRAYLAVAIAAAALSALTACTSDQSTGPTSSTSGSGSGSTGPVSSTPSSTAPALAAVITTTPGKHTSINPTTPVNVAVTNGTLTSISMLNQAGKRVSGTMTADKSSWHTTEVLGYGKAYTISAHAVNADGKAVASRTRFTTLEPQATTAVSMDRMGDYGLDNGATYGVAIIPVVHFDTSVPNKAAALKALSVTSSPKVAGAWAWTSDQDAAYRPKDFWPSGTKVTVTANVYGVKVGHGLYGESDASAHFTVGRKELTVADDFGAVHKVRIYNAAGKVLRTMKTSMGQHSGETLPDGSYINFYTLDGTYTVLEHDNPAIMDSQSYGLPATSPHGYGKLSVPYSTKVSTDGIYLHEFNSTIYDQDNGLDVSEGCLNLRTSDAVWYYDHTLIGDPVIVHGAKGAPEIAVDEGGDWSVPWSKWSKGGSVY